MTRLSDYIKSVDNKLGGKGREKGKYTRIININFFHNILRHDDIYSAVKKASVPTYVSSKTYIEELT